MHRVPNSELRPGRIQALTNENSTLEINHSTACGNLFINT